MDSGCSKHTIDTIQRELIKKKLLREYLRVWGSISGQEIPFKKKSNLFLGPLRLDRFRITEFEVKGHFINDMIYETFMFTTESYRNLSENCFSGDWLGKTFHQGEKKFLRTFENSFLFMGSVATTVGYGQIVPQTKAGKICCLGHGINYLFRQ